jgi:hypothetical protein
MGILHIIMGDIRTTHIMGGMDTVDIHIITMATLRIIAIRSTRERGLTEEFRTTEELRTTGADRITAFLAASLRTCRTAPRCMCPMAVSDQHTCPTASVPPRTPCLAAHDDRQALFGPRRRAAMTLVARDRAWIALRRMLPSVELPGAVGERRFPDGTGDAVGRGADLAWLVRHGDQRHSRAFPGHLHDDQRGWVLPAGVVEPANWEHHRMPAVSASIRWVDVGADPPMPSTSAVVAGNEVAHRADCAIAVPWHRGGRMFHSPTPTSRIGSPSSAASRRVLQKTATRTSWRVLRNGPRG